MNKPDWKDAPEWAQWLAQDSDGEWYWFEVKPVLTESNDDSGEGVFMYPLSEYKNDLLSGLAGKDCYNPNWRDTLESQLTPRSLGCFEEVAKVIGEDAAEIELRTVIDNGSVGAEQDESPEADLLFCFTWENTPQGERFWRRIRDGHLPDNYHQPSKETSSEYWDGETWPIPAGKRCIIRGSSSGIPCEAVVDYMDDEHCIWHWQGDVSASTIHNNVQYMEFSPVKSAREEMIERIEAYFPNKAGVLSYEEIAEFVLDMFEEK